MIPKKIHYCWFGPAPLPKLAKRCIASWRELMPDYEICLWNEQNSPMDHPFVREAYAAKKYAFVADYVRFWALYSYGGIYLDTDMYAVRNFDSLLDNAYFSAWETPHALDDKGNEMTEDTIISCGAIGTIAKGDAISAIYHIYETFTFDAEETTRYIVTRITTPILRERLTKITIYPYDSFYPLPYQERFAKNWIEYATTNTYAIHLWNISWGSTWGKIRDWLIYLYNKNKN